jgi:hypothetical protein
MSLVCGGFVWKSIWFEIEGLGIMRSTPAELKASCPLHRRNERTGCKRILRMANGTSEELVQVRLACQYWCSLALSVNRQRHHVRLPLDVVPLLEVFEAARIDSGPTEAVKTDVELDMVER